MPSGDLVPIQRHVIRSDTGRPHTQRYWVSMRELEKMNLSQAYDATHVGEVHEESIRDMWRSWKTSSENVPFRAAMGAAHNFNPLEDVGSLRARGQERRSKTDILQDFADHIPTRIDVEAARAFTIVSQSRYPEDKTVRLYRGVVDEQAVNLAGDIEHDLSCDRVSSWSEDPETAWTFQEEHPNGAILAVDVPRESILASWRGVDQHDGEKEVVIQSNGSVVARVLHAHTIGDDSSMLFRYVDASERPDVELEPKPDSAAGDRREFVQVNMDAIRPFLEMEETDPELADFAAYRIARTLDNGTMLSPSLELGERTFSTNASSTYTMLNDLKSAMNSDTDVGDLDRYVRWNMDMVDDDTPPEITSSSTENANKLRLVREVSQRLRHGPEDHGNTVGLWGVTWDTRQLEFDFQRDPQRPPPVSAQTTALQLFFHTREDAESWQRKARGGFVRGELTRDRGPGTVFHTTVPRDDIVLDGRLFFADNRFPTRGAVYAQTAGHVAADQVIQ